MRWYKKLGIHIFQSMLVNAHYLYNLRSEQKKSLYDFRLEVIDGLLGSPSVSSRPTRSNVRHLQVPCKRNDKGKVKKKTVQTMLGR